MLQTQRNSIVKEIKEVSHSYPTTDLTKVPEIAEWYVNALEKARGDEDEYYGEIIYVTIPGRFTVMEYYDKKIRKNVKWNSQLFLAITFSVNNTSHTETITSYEQDLGYNVNDERYCLISIPDQSLGNKLAYYRDGKLRNIPYDEYVKIRREKIIENLKATIPDGYRMNVTDFYIEVYAS